MRAAQRIAHSVHRACVVHQHVVSRGFSAGGTTAVVAAATGAEPLKWLGRAFVGLSFASSASAVALHLTSPAVAEQQLSAPPLLTPPTLVELVPRAAVLCCLFLPLLLVAPFAAFFPRLHASLYDLLTTTLARAGPAFIKWGQWAATRPDLFPPALCEALSQLHRQAPAHGWAHTRREVRAAFGGQSLDDVFIFFDPEPLGSGSIAQVHVARLRCDPTRDVAVKVRHPNVEDRMRTDFELLGQLAALADHVPALAALRLRDTLAQFGHVMAAQVFLSREGGNLKVLGANLRSAPHIGVSVPTPLHPPGQRDACDAVLVETYEPGQPLSIAIAKGNLTGEARRHVVQSGKEAYLNMVLVDHFCHADMHAGNILLETVPGRAPKLVLVDAGMVDRLSSAEAEAFASLFLAFGHADGLAAADALFACCKTHKAGDEPSLDSVPRASTDANAREQQRIALGQSMQRVFDTHCRGFRTGADVGAALRGTLGALREHAVRLDGKSAATLVNLLCVQSFAHALDPDYCLLDASEGVLRAHAVLGTATLRLISAAVSPAVATARAVHEAFVWRLPHVLANNAL